MLLWTQFAFFFAISLSWQFARSEIDSALLPLEARDDSSSQEEDIISTSYVLPNQIFNDGKPYYASKDPISGQLDFSSKKPAGIETAANEVVNPKEKIVLSNSAPNIHDFLNLPVKYSSSKFVYPLVSSSYANLKYQGSNKNYITNKKPVSVEATAITPTPDYNRYTVQTTKLMPVPSFAPFAKNISTSTTTTTTTMATTIKTTKKPTKTYAPSTTPITHPTTTSIKTSIATSTSIVTSPKYTSVSRKPVPTSPTTTSTQSTAPTRKKFTPTKKYTSTWSTSTSSGTPLRFPEQQPLNSTASTHPNEGPPSTTSTFTLKYPTKQSSTPATDSTRTSTVKINTPNTKGPITITKNPQQSPSTQSISSVSSTRVPNLDPADVYQTLGQKNTMKENQNEQNPSMTLADIFNSLAEEESTASITNQGNQGFDDQGNLMQPFKPSKPSPFVIQEPQHSMSTSLRPSQSTSNAPLQYHQNGQQPPQKLFNNVENVISGSQENFNNEYVSYQVKQPNVMEYRPAPGAINNVVISPGQNSASFILGSQQQVGPNAIGTVEKESLFGKEHPVQYGTVINELPPRKPESYPPQLSPPQNSGLEEPPAPPSPYQQLPLIGGPNLRPSTAKPQHDPQVTQNEKASSATNQPQNYPQATQQEISNSVDLSHSNTKEISLQSNIRFPMNEEQWEENLSNSVGAGPPAGPHVNGHAQPLSLQQIQQSNNVVFPQTKDEEPSSFQYQGLVRPNDIQIQQHEVVTMNQHKQKLNLPQSSDHLTPSTQMKPPPPPPPSTDFPKRPHINRPRGPPPPFAYNEYTRKPMPGIARPNPDRHLPNILPQFRPNAKISSGHTNSNFNQEPGMVHIPPGPPQFAHRRQPMPQPPRYPSHRASDYGASPSGMIHPNEANRRIYRLPPLGGQGLPYVDRPYGRQPMPYAAIRPNLAERHAHHEPELYKTLTNPDIDLPPERMAAFEEEDLVINDPPQPVTPSKEQKSIDESKLEPVVTLQMLKSQKKPFSLPNDDTGSGEIQVHSELDNNESNAEKLSSQNGLYVVYPMADKKTDTSDMNYAKDVTPAIAQVETATRSGYQNTPFAVVRDQPQEPILTVKNKKPQSLQQQSKSNSLKDKFPYPIEKPDPSYTELNAQNRVPGVVVAPRIVHGSFSAGTETPIAMAYSPTEPSPYKTFNQKYSNVNLANSVIGEIRTESQTEEGLSNDFDIRSHNLEKNFMAPFYPSVSLESATHTPGNGWNILSSSTDTTMYEKNKINRADIADTNENTDSNENQNNNFETDNFQPELQGGFKPIYPPGYIIDETNENENMQQHESNNRPLALASHMSTTPRIYSSSGNSVNAFTTEAAPLSTTARLGKNSTEFINGRIKTSNEASPTETDSKPIENQSLVKTTTKAPNETSSQTPRNKTHFETSLEALLFGDDASFDSEARKQKDKPISSPLIAPRSGPRNLKLS